MLLDLTQTLEEDVPYPAVCPPPSFGTVLDNRADDPLNVQQFSLSTHTGTHIDAVRHRFPDGESIDELPLERFTGESVVLDVSREEAGPVDAADLAAAVDRDDLSIRPDDVVLLYMGWGDKYGTDEYEIHPWLTTDAAAWLVDREVSLVGMDTITPDVPGPHRSDDWAETERWPVHEVLLGGDVLIAENLVNLDRIAGERVAVTAFPLKIRDGDGAQTRFVAETEHRVAPDEPRS
ncbi:cyclase family protein [Halorarum halobium]|uniref:cyclase family protein n=1 Tax=Halorarum halobium TaxID=3075121 RepID=UPI0028B04E07|nr:cyclase family protein [Halobaculum sp. XH14]